MPPVQVFVSYSHKDGRALERLQKFLAPLERRQLSVEWWADTRLRSGDDWLAEIEEALARATVAILIVSADFLASGFIVSREVPPLLAKAAAGGLTVLPIFWSPSLVREIDFALPDGHGSRKLADFQGYGSPEKPLTKLSYTKREGEFQQLGKRLIELAGSPASSARVAAPVRPSPRASAPPPPAAHEPAEAFELTVDLVRAGEVLEVRYLRPGTEPLGSARRPWGDASGPLTEVSRRLSIASARVLSDWLKKAPQEIGANLFRLLFGEPTEWGPLLRALFGTPAGSPRPNPVRHTVRLRIATADPLLLGLPWRLTAWDGRLLVRDGWTFETTSVAEPGLSVSTPAPCPVLVATAGELPDPAHLQALREMLGAVWPNAREEDYWRPPVTTAGELENALSGMRPHLLYLYGAEPLAPLAELPELFRKSGHTPAVVILELAGFGEEGAAPPPEILGATVPLLLWRRLPEWTEEAPRLSLTWLRRWFAEAIDPVVALRVVVTEEEFRATLEGATLAVHANYRHWATAPPPGAAVAASPLKKLDRTQQKALVLREVLALVRNDRARVLALVAYAEPGNAVGSLSSQLQHDLELEADREAAFSWFTPKFPLQRDRLGDFLDGELRLGLASDPHEPLEHLLRRRAPQALIRGERRGVLWLNWGSFGEGNGHQPELFKPDLESWLAFLGGVVARKCPSDLRVVSFLAMESPEKRHKRLTRILHDCENEHCQIDELSLTLLPPLGSVSEADLRKYLKEHGCPQAYQGEIARLAERETGGVFEATVPLLDEAERTSWFALLSRLRRKKGPSSPDDHEPL